jgi:REP element-mobilizing transposase RayT
MRPSRIGRIVEEAWLDIPNHHTHITLDALVLMPNHIHGVLLIGDAGRTGAAGRAPTLNAFVPARSGSLSAIVRSFKSGSTRAVNLLRNSPGAPLWQRNYYEHIIRNDENLSAIRQYIADNPVQWALDEENPNRGIVKSEPKKLSGARPAAPCHVRIQHTTVILGDQRET